MSHEKILEEVTSTTLKEVATQDIVLPENYAQIFKKYLEQKDLLEDYDSGEVIKELSDTTLDKAQTLMDKAHGALGSLDGYVQTAQHAIVTKDEDSLADVLTLVESMKEEIKHLRGEVYIDSLTQIYNRKWIFDKLLDKEGNFLFSGSMAFMDLNSFKPINDKLGHDVGDKVLVYMGQMLRKIVLADKNLAESHVIRYAGDEFTVISTTSQDHLTKTLQNAYKKLTSKVFQSNSKKFSLSFSFGISSFEKGDDFIKTMKVADKAMYANKKIIKETEKKHLL
jgi:diguanylate cyclase (GGDEF)-like protein